MSSRRLAKPFARTEREGWLAIRSSLNKCRRAKDGGEGGIRTHVPFRTRRFRGAPVTTTSVPLRISLRSRGALTSPRSLRARGAFGASLQLSHTWRRLPAVASAKSGPAAADSRFDWRAGACLPGTRGRPARDRADRSRQFSILPRTAPSGSQWSARRASRDIRSR